MRRLLHYLKPYTALILITIVLLFIQANADLALPDYLSRIVNNGIQGSGVDSAVPIAIRHSQMEKLLVFLEEEDAQIVLDAYQLLGPDSPEIENFLDDYPLITQEQIYILKEISQSQRDELDHILAKTLVVVSGIQGMIDDPTRENPFGAEFEFDPSLIPDGMDPFQALAMMSESQRAEMTGKLDKMVEALGENALTQMAISAIKLEYEIIGIDVGSLQQNYIIRTGGIMLLISLLGGICRVIGGYFASRTAAGAARDIRKDIFKKVESFSSSEFDIFSTASLITRSTNDITQVQHVIFMSMRMVMFAPILGIGGIIRAIDKSANMWWLIALAVIALLGIVLVIFLISVPKFKLMQDLIDRLNLITRENLSGMMVIRAFNKQEGELDRFDQANRNLTDTSLFVARVMVTMFPIMMLLMNGLSLAIIWVGAQQVAQAALQVGDMMAFMQYAMQIVFAFLMMSMMFIFLPRAAVSGERIADVLETDLVINDPEDPKKFSKPFQGTIEFRDVSFRYPNAEDDVIRDISFTARPGETTAFIGSTGCGKSTVINLIPRFYDPTKGSVLLDGIDIREVKQNDLRDKIGFVPQKGTLFSGTVRTNLLYADQDAGDEVLDEAVEIAQAKDFIDAADEGMELEISQGGTNVSGGQRQRLAIARALVKKPPIFIFDDSFSALDFKTDSTLRKEIKRKTGDSTVLIVTQRVATVMNADQIIVLDEGRVVGKGTHRELLKTCQTYQEIASSQLSEEELA
jgi:ATP-binding cassette subfamily B protein